MTVSTLKFERRREGTNTVVVSNIQRFSVHDGPGIRTVVFVQGCPLRCKWCQNPEDLRVKPQLLFNPGECIGCGECLKACSRGATVLGNEERISIDRDTCIGCGDCVTVCHPGARKLSGKNLTVQEVFREILKDEEFYKNSNGGVTLSGGEITMFPDFAAELLQLCRNHGIHTAIETCGYASWENMEKTAGFCDLVLYDIKVVDPLKAQKWTGVDNELILENGRKLAELGKSMIIRVPLITGVNDDTEEFSKIVDFTISLRTVKTIHILPFHHLGKSKYEMLDLEYSLAEVAEPDEESIQRCVAVAEGSGLRVSVGGSGFISERNEQKDKRQESGFIYKF